MSLVSPLDSNIIKNIYIIKALKKYHKENLSDPRPPLPGNETSPAKPPPKLSPLPLLDISNASSPQSSPQLSPTQIEEGWFVAPPPCFTRDSPGKIEVSPLEDLLIEHPSMSVYAQVPGVQQGGCAQPKDKAAKRTNNKELRARPLASYATKPKPNGAKTQLDLKSEYEFMVDYLFVIMLKVGNGIIRCLVVGLEVSSYNKSDL